MYFWVMETLTHAPVLARFGYAVSDKTRARILLALADAPAYPSELADSLGVSPAEHVQPPDLPSRLRPCRYCPGRPVDPV